MQGVCPTPPCVVTEYCARGSLNDVLRGARNVPAKAAQLDWARRLNMVRLASATEAPSPVCCVLCCHWYCVTVAGLLHWHSSGMV